MAVILSAGDARRVLDGPPDEFLIANREKRAALRRFQPHGLLVSEPPDRPRRRRFNEEILGTGCPRHRLAGVIDAEAARASAEMLAAAAADGGQLTWELYARHWWRLVRRVMLGEQARDDERLTDLLAELRAAANWAYLAPRRARARGEFLARLGAHLARAEDGSLSQLIAQAGAEPGVHAGEQVPQWLFASDGAALATIRALALVHAAPDPVTDLRPYLLESLRLWPTTPAILRDTGRDTVWSGGVLPAGSTILIYSPFLHRDDAELAQPDRLHPELWAAGAPDPPWAVPFSRGPGACPGRDLVTLLATRVLAGLGERTRPAPGSELRADRPLPGTLDPFRLRFAVSPSRSRPAAPL